MRLVAKVIRISRAKFHCNILTTVEDIQDYAISFFGTQCSSPIILQFVHKKTKSTAF